MFGLTLGKQKPGPERQEGRWLGQESKCKGPVVSMALTGLSISKEASEVRDEVIGDGKLGAGTERPLAGQPLCCPMAGDSN